MKPVMKPFARFVLAAFAATSAAVMAQGQDSANQGYLVDGSGRVVMSGGGLCFRHQAPDQPPVEQQCDAAYKTVGNQNLVFDADTLFDFDKSTLRPAGRATLDNFVDRIKGINPEAIMVVGHASRPGTEKYNQRLSEDRAAAVKTYLIGAGIAPNRVRASGRGETQPVTGTYECFNDLSAESIACRQADRHVAIELIGARIPR